MPDHPDRPDHADTTRAQRLTRRELLRAALAAPALVASAPGAAWALGDQSRVSLGLIEHEGGWNARPSALRRLAMEVEKRTSVFIAPVERSAAPTAITLFETPLVFLTGERGWTPWPNAAILRLRAYLQAGGMLVVDSSEGVKDGAFIKSARRELARIYPDQQPRALPTDHVLYKSFYFVDTPRGRVLLNPALTGWSEGDRVSVVLGENDLLGAWARDNIGAWVFEVEGGEAAREMAFRLGINLVMYALCVNYKEDQVHIPFILKRRQWRVKPR